MADLIDKTLKDLKWYLDTNEEKGAAYFPKFCIENMIKNLKQADTERHAHWIENKEFGVHCSNCGRKEVIRYDYCRCGCKMDEVEDETQNNRV